jgi:hypothetical protein
MVSDRVSYRECLGSNTRPCVSPSRRNPACLVAEPGGRQIHHSKHHATYVTNFNVTMEKYKEAEVKRDVGAMIALQGAIKFNGGGTAPHPCLLAPCREPYPGSLDIHAACPDVRTLTATLLNARCKVALSPIHGLPCPPSRLLHVSPAHSSYRLTPLERVASLSAQRTTSPDGNPASAPVSLQGTTEDRATAPGSRGSP